MEEIVKNKRSGHGQRSRQRSASRISAKHQVTIPVKELRKAGLHEGDQVRMTTTGRGRIELVSVDELLDSFIGCLPAGAFADFSVQKLREEWE